MHLKRKLVLVLFLLLVVGIEAWATHIRAGEITAIRISQTSLRYRFKIVLYTDTESTVQAGEGGLVDFGQGTVFGIRGGNSRPVLEEKDIDGRFDEELVGNLVRKTVMEFIFTFDAPGVYTVSYTEENRNDNILNINNGASLGVAFHIETVLRIDPAFGVNGTPVLTTPPIDRACIGGRFIHNPGAFDPDGDSLAYKLVVPQQNRGETVDNYRALDDASLTNIKEDGSSPSVFSIDSITGNFVWDAPQIAGEYNAAFIVEEWRFSDLTDRWELLGYVTRDMQIVVEDCNNDRPELTIPDDLCVEAGTTIDENILGTDPDGNRVKIEAFGGVFEDLNISPAQFTPEPDFRDQPSIYNFNWLTHISHVREKPYEIVFKISDEPFDDKEPALVDFKTWEIKVVAPAPEGLNSAIASGQSIQLVWDEYVGKDFSPVMQIWRKQESFDFTPEECVTGIPANSGYELIDEVPINQLSYVDDNNVRPGVKYCYRIVAKFPRPKGGESYASMETCTTIPLDVPAITNVSVDETDPTNGEITVAWTPPLEIDQTLFPPPFRYELVRYTGLNGVADRTLITSTNDLTFVDTNLNTTDNPYHYRIVFYDAADNLIDSSATASSVRLDALGLLQSVELRWRADVPWSNKVQDFPTHSIYRNRTDVAADDENNFVLIDQVDVTQSPFFYLDDGSFNGVPLLDDREYCYYVVTQGSYGNPLIAAPQINDSQIICVLPNDNVPPNDPDITVDDPTDVITVDGVELTLLQSPNCSAFENERCGFENYSNTFEWTVDNADNDIARYNIYFSPSGREDSFTLVGTSTETRFTHTGLSSFKGCYKVSSVDRSNNESELSNAVCFDNCPNYELPNAFTPNGDGVNDLFTAFDQPNSRCPRFVESVEVHIFNRWGGTEVFTFDSRSSTENSVLINWDGRDNNGKELPSGTYYYQVIVEFDVFDPAQKTQEFKNWVKLIR